MSNLEKKIEEKIINNLKNLNKKYFLNKIFIFWDKKYLMKYDFLEKFLQIRVRTQKILKITIPYLIEFFALKSPDSINKFY